MDKIRRILLLLLSVGMVISLCSCKDEQIDPEDQIIYYNIDTEPETLDPQIANDAGARLVIMNIFEGLVRLDENEEPVPGAAESWEISGDRMMYTFHLRSGLKWNDGSTLKAEDFRFGIRRTLQPETGSETASTLFCIRNAQSFNNGSMNEDSLGVFVRGDDTVVIQLEYPEQDFLQLLASPQAMPCSKSFFESTGGQYGREADKLLTNGPFYVRENGWEHSGFLYLRKNREYAGRMAVVPAGVNITIGSAPEDVCAAIGSGRIDCGAIASADEKRASGMGLHLTGFGDTVWGIMLNTSEGVLKNKDIRCGLLLSLDREEIMKELPGGCVLTDGIIPAGANLGEFSYRETAGSPKPLSGDAGKLLEKGLEAEKLSSMPNITILCADDEATQVFVNNILEKWNSLTGCYFNKKPVPLSVLRDMLDSGSYEAAVAPLTVSGSSPLNTLELFGGSGRTNYSCLQSEEYNALVEEIRRSESGSEDTVMQAEQYLIDNGIFMPLYIENRYYATAAEVTGIIFHPYGAEADFSYALKTRES